jgi:hypothetical protein
MARLAADQNRETDDDPDPDRWSNETGPPP